jgi:hypothetical protein
MQQSNGNETTSAPENQATTISQIPAHIPWVRGPMKYISWSDIWHSLQDARKHGNGEPIEVFYLTLFKDAVFDDNGAWSMDLRKPS